MMIRENYGHNRAGGNNRNANNNQRNRKRNKGSDFRSSIITERFLTMLLKACSSTTAFKRNHFLNFQKFISQLPMENYEKDVNIYALILAVKAVVKNKLENVVDKEELIEMVNLEILENFDDVKENIIYPTILSGDETTEKERLLVQKTIDSYLRYDAVLAQKENLSDILTDIGSGNVGNLDESLEAFRDTINIIYDEFKKTEMNQDKYSFIHTSEQKEYVERLKAAHDYATSPRMVLRTGLKLLNEMLSTQGGFLGGKFYMFYADTNTFKSALLKYITKWIQKYNSAMFMEEFLATGKRPTVLYISLEDGEIEDTNRLFTTFTAKDLMSIENFEEVKKFWTEAYNGVDNIIDITQVNSTENSINLETVKGFIKMLEEQNYFVVAIVCDSFDLMAPSDEDIYRGISDDTTIFANRAKAIQKFIGDKPYPWITAHQLNRNGNQFIMEKKDKGVIDLAKTLGRSFISGAYDIERRVHFSAFLYTEWSKYDNELYLEIKREKVKYKKTPTDYVVHWLENGFVLHDDYGTDATNGRTSIVPQDANNAYTCGASDIGTRGITSIANMNKELGAKHDEEEEDEEDDDIDSGLMFATKSESVKPVSSIAADIPVFIPQYTMPMYWLTSELGFTPYDTAAQLQPEYAFGNDMVTPFDL